ncbi:MAG: heparinase II/III family protein [Clostridia bacterium]|nr:heparinase II/III family protein [Clostridia bacterium]
MNHLLGKATNPDFWNEVREKPCFEQHRKALAEMWKNDCNKDLIPALRYSDYKQYWITGDRKAYERNYFSRRRALECSAILSLVYPEDEQYLTYLNDVIFAVCNEYSWCLPAHQGKLEPINETMLDLFACETGFALSETYHLLGDRLDPLIRNRIRAEIDRRIVTPFTAVDNYGGWENGTANWTAVCMGSIACTMMLMRPELVDESLLTRFNASMNRYLSGFLDDGICLEGCGYWYYGFGFFTVYADMVRKFTEGKVDYFKLEKVSKVAQFIQNSMLNEKISISFADGGGTFSYHTGIIHYLKDQYPTLVNVYDPCYSSDKNPDSCARFCLYLRSFTWLNEDYYNNPTPIDSDAEYYAEVSQWLIKRNANYGFAAKGGCNAEPHNHNDVGAFIFAKDGQQAITDLGAGLYTRQYFAAATRYTIIENSSRSHSVPIVDGELQILGRDARATDVQYKDGIFSMNIAAAYGKSDVMRIDRSFAFTSDSVTLTDEYEFAGEHSIVERLTSRIEPQIAEDGKIILGSTTVTYDPTVCTCQISSEPTSPNPNKLCYMIDFKLNDGVKKFSCTVR